MRQAQPFIPVLALTLLTFWGGALFGGASFSGAVTAHLTLLLLAVVAAPAWTDPLALGSRGRLLTAALLVTVAASWWLSPVARAGRVGLLLLPAFLLAPAAVARCWSRRRDRTLGLTALALLTAVTALLSLLWMWRLASPRAAMPLGHHNLLAGWLVFLWPVSVLPLWSTRSAPRLAGIVAGLVAAALAASASLTAGVAVVGQAVLVMRWWRRTRRWVIVALALLLASQSPRLARLAREPDLSLQARAVYLQAGWQAAVDRPALGWGPGSVAWTAARFVRPRPGVNPPSEIVGDLHSLPAQLVFEIGLSGLLVTCAIFALFVRRRLAELPAAADPELLRASLVALAGGAVFALGNSQLTVLALPLAASIVAGTALSGSAKPRDLAPRRGVAVVTLYATITVIFLLPSERAHFHYQQARLSGAGPQALESLGRAAALDPEFPLYQARQAWQMARRGDGPAAAKGALQAARGAVGLAPLWLAAGSLAADSNQPWARSALLEAVRLDPLSPLASFHIMRSLPKHPAAARWGSRALRAEPRLAAANFWSDHPELRRQVMARLDAAHGARARRVLEATTAAGGDESATLALTMDTEGAVSFSLYAFRRSPWPAALAPVELNPRLLVD